MTGVLLRSSQGEAPAAARAIRRRVFVEEQGVLPEEEWDAHDEPGAPTLHFVAWRGGEAVGCARLRPLGAAAKVERVAVLRERRTEGVGRALMEAAEAAAWRRGCAHLELHAQTAVLPFYERLGWHAHGGEFLEAGIAHRAMEKRSPAPPAGEAWRRLSRPWLRGLVAELAELPGVEAVVLGGSHARGLARDGSDVDLGLLYRDRRPLDVAAVRALAARWHDAPNPTVSELYEWGPWVNGGAWLTVQGERVDLLFRGIERVEGTIAAARAGRYEIHFAQQPPFGFWSGTILGECACALPLHDPSGVVEALRAQVAAYPPALRSAVRRDMLGGAAFTLAAFAPKFAARGDVVGTVACLARAVWQLALALLALDHRYLVSDKTLLDEVEAAALAPPQFRARAEAALASPGQSPAGLASAVEAIAAIARECDALAELGGFGTSLPPEWKTSSHSKAE